MSDTDPLADLGLDEPTATAKKPASKPTTKTVAAKSSKASDTKKTKPVADAATEEVDVGEIEIGTASFIPSAKRTRGGSKYPFDRLAKPGKGKDGKPSFSQFTVRLQDGVDANKLRRSVQSATTQANKQGAAEGKYFVSRSLSEDGAFVGMQVFRTDEKQ